MAKVCAQHPSLGSPTSNVLLVPLLQHMLHVRRPTAGLSPNTVVFAIKVWVPSCSRRCSISVMYISSCMLLALCVPPPLTLYIQSHMYALSAFMPITLSAPVLDMTANATLAEHQDSIPLDCLSPSPFTLVSCPMPKRLHGLTGSPR